MGIFNQFLESASRSLYSLVKKNLNFTEFANELNNLAINMERGARLEIATTMCELYRDIIQSTPVDSGFAQSNWQIGESKNNSVLNQQARELRDSQPFYSQYTRLVPPPPIPDPSSFLGASRLYIFNNVDYIDDLRAGSSPQAGPGEMVEDNVARHQLELIKKLKDSKVFK